MHFIIKWREKIQSTVSNPQISEYRFPSKIDSGKSMMEKYISGATKDL